MKTKHDGSQVLYADQPAELSLGPFVSRLTLGIVESQSDAPIPVLSFAMPTTALLQMAKDIILQIENPSFAVGAARSLALAADALSPGTGEIDSVRKATDSTPRRTAKGRSAGAHRTAARK